MIYEILMPIVCICLGACFAVLIIAVQERKHKNKQAIEFAEWIEDKAVHRHSRFTMKENIAEAPEWENNDWLILWTIDEKQFVKNTQELYNLFKEREK